MRTRWLWIAIFLTVLHPALASEKVANFEKTCLEIKKKASLCRCLWANVERKLASQELTAEQIPVAVQALKGQPPEDPDANSTAYDNVADLLAGLEPHCLKNPKYSGE